MSPRTHCEAKLSDLHKGDSPKLTRKNVGSLTANLKSHPFWDFWGPIVVTLSMCIGIRHFIAELRYIPSGSMLPGLQINDRLLIEKLTFYRRKPRKGEIVVFNSPESFASNKQRPSHLKCALLNFPLVESLTGISDPACYAYIKRVVAVSGDHVLVNLKGEVLINGKKINEPYVTNYCLVDEERSIGCSGLDERVPIGHVVVLGDNRGSSNDSRAWEGGPFLPEKEILGRAVWRYWPISRIGLLSS